MKLLIIGHRLTVLSVLPVCHENFALLIIVLEAHYCMILSEYSIHFRIFVKNDVKFWKM